MFKSFYIKVLKDICPKCGAQSERLGFHFDKLEGIKKSGWNCENCGFRELAEIPDFSEYIEKTISIF
jgi:DNA-directed RNA polymerase subunit RPC12/RpoP